MIWFLCSTSTEQKLDKLIKELKSGAAKAPLYKKAKDLLAKLSAKSMREHAAKIRELKALLPAAPFPVAGQDQSEPAMEPSADQDPVPTDIQPEVAGSTKASDSADSTEVAALVVAVLAAVVAAEVAAEQKTSGTTGVSDTTRPVGVKISAAKALRLANHQVVEATRAFAQAKKASANFKSTSNGSTTARVRHLAKKAREAGQKVDDATASFTSAEALLAANQSSSSYKGKKNYFHKLLGDADKAKTRADKAHVAAKAKFNAVADAAQKKAYRAVFKAHKNLTAANRRVMKAKARVAREL